MQLQGVCNHEPSPKIILPFCISIYILPVLLLWKTLTDIATNGFHNVLLLLVLCQNNVSFMIVFFAFFFSAVFLVLSRLSGPQ